MCVEKLYALSASQKKAPNREEGGFVFTAIGYSHSGSG